LCLLRKPRKRGTAQFPILIWKGIGIKMNRIFKTVISIITATALILTGIIFPSSAYYAGDSADPGQPVFRLAGMDPKGSAGGISVSFILTDITEPTGIIGVVGKLTFNNKILEYNAANGLTATVAGEKSIWAYALPPNLISEDTVKFAINDAQVSTPIAENGALTLTFNFKIKNGVSLSLGDDLTFTMSEVTGSSGEEMPKLVYGSGTSVGLKNSLPQGMWIDGNAGFLCGIVANGMNTSGAYSGFTFKDAKGNNLTGNALIGTGCVLIMDSGAQYPVVVRGDTDGDGTIKGNDYIIAIKLLLEYPEVLAMDGTYKSAADADNNGIISGNDYIIIMKHFFGMIDIYDF